MIAIEEEKLKKKTSQSDDSSFDSTASRINFWKDINTKEEDYKNVVLIK